MGSNTEVRIAELFMFYSAAVCIVLSGFNTSKVKVAIAVRTKS